MHGGHVQAYSEVEKQGSTFEIRLPRIALPLSNSEKIAENVNPKSRRILLVDDNVDAAGTIVMLLQI